MKHNSEEKEDIQKPNDSDGYDMYDFYLENQPAQTPEEIAELIEQDKKCSDYILKHGITPNLDSPY